LAILILASLYVSTVSSEKERTKAQPRRPNIVVFMTDDQDVQLRSMDYMTKTKEKIVQSGTTFSNSFTTSPICCPSRSSFLTGLYAHNHNVLTNTLLCGSQDWKDNYESRSFATFLQKSGYNTGYFGKYLNEYKGEYTPPGWNMWQGLLKNSKYYNYSIWNQGKREHHNDNYAEDYLTDLVLNRSMEFFRKAKRNDREEPVISVLSFPAPHGPEAGAPQYQHMFENVTSHITPTYNYGPNPDKHWILQHIKFPIDAVQHKFSQVLQQKRLQTLMSVDDAVDKFVDMLEEIGELDNTYILYTSDHGFHIGQFGLAKGKSMPYDFDTRVPFYIRGPDVPRNKTLNDIVLNVDIAPTILGVAGVEIPEFMDGRNFMPLLRDRTNVNPPWRDRFLIQKGKVPKKCKPTEPSKQQRLQQTCITQREKFDYPCKPDQQSFCDFNSTTKIWKMKKCRNELKKKKKTCKCLENEYGNYTMEMTRKESQNLKNHCEKKFLKFKSMAKEYANNELSKFFKKQKNKHINRRKTKITRNKKRRKRRYLEKKEKNGFKQERRSLRKQGQSQRLKKGNRRKLTSQKHRPNRSKALFSKLSCNHLSKAEQKMKCNKLVGEIRKAYKHFFYGVRKNLSVAMHRMSKRIDGSVFRKCMEIMRPSCKCNLKIKRPKPSKSPNVKPSIEDIYRPGNSLPDAKIQKRKKKPLTASRKCAETTNNSTSTSGMTCFRLDKEKWKVPPRWQGDERCYCTNSNNNTYWCLRIINETTNSLYCVFVTDFVEYMDYNKENGEEKLNTYSEQPFEKISIIHNDLKRLSKCKGNSIASNNSCHIPRGGFNQQSSAVDGSDTNFCGHRDSLLTTELVQPILLQNNTEIAEESQNRFEKYMNGDRSSFSPKQQQRSTGPMNT